MSRTNRLLACICIMVSLVLLTGVAPAQDAPEKEPPIVGGVKILPDKQGLEIEGQVCLTKGILEFVGVIKGMREYESILSLNCKPSALHASLLAMEAKQGVTPSQLESWKERHADDADAKEPALGSRLIITVRWKTADGTVKEVPATSLLFNRKTNKVEPAESGWYFTGSFFGQTLEGKEVYVADIDGAVVSVSQDSGAVINLGPYAGNPYDAEDEGFAVLTEAVPEVGTPVTMRISLEPPKQDKEKEDAGKEGQ